MTRFACGYCGTEQIVERKGGTVILKGLSEAINRVQAGTDKTAAELALRRLTDEMQAVNSARAWNLAHAAGQRRANTTMMIWMFIAGLVIAGIVIGADGKGRENPVGGLVTLLLFAGVGIAIKIGRDKHLETRLDIAMAPLDHQWHDINGKIETNRKIVDS